MWKALSAAVLPILVTGAVAAGPLEDGNAAYGRGDFVAAARFYRMGADRGLPAAQTALGLLYETGQGVGSDPREATKWYRRAAESGHVEAMVNLAVLYSDTAQSIAEGAKWLQVAADLGHAPAQAMLGFTYASGRGVARDLVAARMWLTLAAARLPPGRERDEAIRNRESVALKLTAAQNDEARALAASWRPKGAAAPEASPTEPVAERMPPPYLDAIDVGH